MSATIKSYVTSDIRASQSLLSLEMFIGDVDGKTVASPTDDNHFIDEGTVDAEDAVLAINVLVEALERRDSEIERLQKALTGISQMKAEDLYIADGQPFDNAAAAYAAAALIH